MGTSIADKVSPDMSAVGLSFARLHCERKRAILENSHMGAQTIYSEMQRNFAAATAEIAKLRTKF